MKNKTKQEQWNSVYNNFTGNRASVWREDATPFFTDKIDYLRYKKIKTVLDAGCGDGRNLMAFAKAGFSVTGVDISDIALKRCKSNLKSTKNVTLKRGLLEEMNLKPGSFGAIICDFVLVHVEDVERVISNFYKVLKPGGFALLEFISTKDERCNKGKRVGKNKYIQHGVFIRSYDLKDIETLMKKFRILFVESQHYTDPDHGSGYHRKHRHTHHSYFVVAQKNNPTSS